MPTKQITIENLTRQERLMIWMSRAGLRNADISRATGATRASVLRWFSSDTLPPYRHQQLVDLGIPADLLPPPVYLQGGTTENAAQSLAENMAEKARHQASA